MTMMRSLALAIAFMIASMVPSSAQKGEIEATNAKLIEFFNKGDSLESRHSTPPMRPHCRRVLQRCAAQRPSRQCGKPWRNSLAI
jgi:hypothetical protein